MVGTDVGETGDQKKLEWTSGVIRFLQDHFQQWHGQSEWKNWIKGFDFDVLWLRMMYDVHAAETNRCSWHKCSIYFQLDLFILRFLWRPRVRRQNQYLIPAASPLTGLSVTFSFFLPRSISFEHCSRVWFFFSLHCIGKKLWLLLGLKDWIEYCCDVIDNINNLTGVEMIPAIYFNEQKNTAQNCISRG